MEEHASVAEKAKRMLALCETMRQEAEIETKYWIAAGFSQPDENADVQTEHHVDAS